MGNPNRLVIGITGASGVILGIHMLRVLKEIKVETHLIISQAAAITIAQETDFSVKDIQTLASFTHKVNDIGAVIASGSFETNGMIVIPCSIKTLSAIANSYADDLITRSADVTLKEGRPLILVVREAPLHKGHIRLMDLAAQSGAVIFPPVPVFYAQPQTMEDVIANIVGRVLARVGIDNDLVYRWGGLKTGLESSHKSE